MKRTPVLAGNWKLNHGPDEARRFFDDFLPRVEPADDRTILFFPPALSLAAAREAATARHDVAFGVQNLYWEAEGAFTGEISAPMAREAGASVALVGHSERRHLFGESEADTARKTRAALDAGLDVVLCVGETLDQREAGEAREVVSRQLEAVFDILADDDLPRLLVAYEPVWAIGTGRTAAPSDAQTMHAAVRELTRARFHSAAAEALPVLYGGSVKPDNAARLLAEPDVDGVLVGGASLDPAAFAAICAAAG